MTLSESLSIDSLFVERLFYGYRLISPLMLGTAQYPSPDILKQAVLAAKPGVITVSLRREGARQVIIRQKRL